MFTIEPTALEDAGELLDIYDHYVRDTAISFEYETPTEEEFRGRMENIMRRYPYLAVRRMGASGAMPMQGLFMPERPTTGAVKPPFICTRTL